MNNWTCYCNNGAQGTRRQGCPLGRCIRRFLTGSPGQPTAQYVFPYSYYGQVYGTPYSFSDCELSEHDRNTYYNHLARSAGDLDDSLHHTRGRIHPRRARSTSPVGRHRVRGGRRGSVTFRVEAVVDDEEDVPDPWGPGNGNGTQAGTGSQNSTSFHLHSWPAEFIYPTPTGTRSSLSGPTIYNAASTATTPRRQTIRFSPKPYYSPATPSSVPLMPTPRMTQPRTYIPAPNMSSESRAAANPGASLPLRTPRATRFGIPTPPSSRPVTPEGQKQAEISPRYPIYPQELTDNISDLVSAMDMIRPYVPPFFLRLQSQSGHEQSMRELWTAVVSLCYSPPAMLRQCLLLYPDLTDELRTAAHYGRRCVEGAHGDRGAFLFRRYTGFISPDDGEGPLMHFGRWINQQAPLWSPYLYNDPVPTSFKDALRLQIAPVREVIKELIHWYQLLICSE